MRDFRDAKTMAHALRDALLLKAVKTSHGECLELIAKTFGYENWNILSAKIELARPPASAVPALSPAATPDDATPKTLYCSFCRKSQHDVLLLIAGPAVFICDECVALCDDLVEDQKIRSLLEADEESSHQGYPATTEYLRAKPTAELASFVEHSRHLAERHRLELSLLHRVLLVRNGEPPAEDLLASPDFARLKDKTSEDLLALAQQAEGRHKGFEDVRRIAAAVLES
jgi:hypothetical protein